MEEEVLQKVDMCAKYLAKQLYDTEASEFKYTIENFSVQDETIGDVEIVVRTAKNNIPWAYY